MKTAFAERDWPFPEEGEVCERCKKQWREQNLPYQRLRAVHSWDGSIARTENKGIPIVCCPHCDGDLIFSLPKEPDDNE